MLDRLFRAMGIRRTQAGAIYLAAAIRIAVERQDGQVAVFEGVEKLSPAPLRASDLRAGAAMVVAALMADGTSEIEEIGHIERGYENIVEKLRGLGADIRKVERMPVALEQAL